MDHNIPGLIGNRSGEMESKMNLKDGVDDFDTSLICKMFPSITFGSAPQVDLYDGTTTYSETNIISETKDFEQHLYDFSEVREVQNTVSEALPSLQVNHSSVQSLALGKDDSFPCPVRPQSVSSIYEEKLDQVTREDSPKKVGLSSQSNLTLNELYLDKSVNCIPGLTKKQCEQLDNCGLHTVGTKNCGLLENV
jgi:ATP-dependent DNA helicase RecG